MADKQCKVECEEPKDVCQDCIQSKIAKKCTTLPTSPCHRCSKLIKDAFPQCENEADIPTCVAGIIEPIEPTCVRCTCTHSCKLYGPLCPFCTLCREGNGGNDYSEYWLHSHANANIKCSAGYILSNDNSNPRCFTALASIKFKFSTAVGTACSSRSAQLAVSDTNEKINAVRDAIRDVPRGQYWVAAQSNFNGKFEWIGAHKLVGENKFRNNCPKPNINLSALFANRNGRLCNLNPNRKRPFVCEQAVCREQCGSDGLCCPGTNCKSNVCVG